MPTRAKLRQMQLSREDYEGIIGLHSDSEEETKEERDETEDEEEEEFDHDFGGIGEEELDYLFAGQDVPTGERLRNLYKASDKCKRHRLPDDEEHTVEVETHKRRKPKKTA
jgi:hypothetical protein